MKKTLFVVFLIAFAYAKGQDNNSTQKEYKTQMKFSIGQFFENSLILDYERQLKNSNGLLLSIGPVYSEISNVTKSGFRSEVQYKLYITSRDRQHSMSRMYVAPYFTYKYIEELSEYTIWYNNNYITTQSKYYFHSFCPGIIAGCNIVSYHRLVFDFYIGGGMKRTFDGDFIGKVDYDNENIFKPGYNGVVPRIGFEMGVTL